MREFVLVIVAYGSLDGCRGGDSAGTKDPPVAGDPVADSKATPPPSTDVKATPTPSADVKATPTPTADNKAAPSTDAATDPCGAAALHLEGTTPLTGWWAPDGCRLEDAGKGQVFLRNQAELAARVPCNAGVSHGVDFTKHAILAVGYTLSPAGAGLGAFDDGKVITLVARQRSPCPNDPRAMPLNTTAWFLVPAGSQRTFANTTCTLAPKCR